MCVFAPIDWWVKPIFAVTLIPLVVWSTIRFYGNEQLWNWNCGSKDRGESE